MIGSKIIKMREELGWSQVELARRSSITSSAISLIEKGDREPTLRVIKAIAKAFNISVAELIGESRINKIYPKEKLFFAKFEIINQLNIEDQKLILSIANRLSK